jgi:FAD:protein FMN transferase
MTSTILVAILAALSGASGEGTRYSFDQPHMGTRFRIILYAANEAAARRAADAAFNRVAELDRIMSDYHPTSELMQLCQNPAAQPGGPGVKVSDDLVKVLAHAQEVARLSDGAFDITVGPLTHLWRRARKNHKMPDEEALREARELIGYRKLHVDEKTHLVHLDQPGMILDLGGIGKGYAADAALEVLERHGMTKALVAAGGDIAVGGSPPGTDGWSIGIAPLDNPESKPARYLILHDAAVSTSGDAEQHLDVDGKRYSHIVDPRTGMGLTGQSSVTVVARHGLIADPLTKVVSVLGPEKGFKIIDSIDGAASFVVRKMDKGVEQTFESRGFAKISQRRDGGSSR